MTPWGEMMRAAIRMGVGPEEFWRLSLKEWRMLTEVGGGAAPLGRGELEMMQAAWPDSPSPGVRREREAKPRAGGDV